MKKIKIGITGKILEGTYKNWFLLVEDDAGDTGGYYILIFNHFDRSKTTAGYDSWAEDFSTLEHMFNEADWKVEWLT